jgi:hypothetical protein
MNQQHNLYTKKQMKNIKYNLINRLNVKKDS